MTILDHIVLVLVAGVCVMNSYNAIRLRQDVEALKRRKSN